LLPRGTKSKLNERGPKSKSLPFADGGVAEKMNLNFVGIAGTGVAGSVWSGASGGEATSFGSGGGGGVAVWDTLGFCFELVVKLAHNDVSSWGGRASVLFRGLKLKSIPFAAEGAVKSNWGGLLDTAGTRPLLKLKTGVDPA